MKIHEWRWRYLLLFFDCFLVFGCYLCADMPSGLQAELQGQQNKNCTGVVPGNNTCCSDCLGLGPQRYNLLYAVFSWTFSFNFHGSCNVRFMHFCSVSNSRCARNELHVSFDAVWSYASWRWYGLCTGSSEPNPGILVQRSTCHDLWNCGFGNKNGERSDIPRAIVCGSCFLSAVFFCITEKYGLEKIDKESLPTIMSKKVRFRDVCQFPASFWFVGCMIMFFYSAYLPFIANGSKFIQDRFGYPKTVSSYMTGALYDVSVLGSPWMGIFSDYVGYRAVTGTVGILLSVGMFPALFYLDISPIIFTVGLGVANVIAVTSMWPAVTLTVPIETVGTATGLVTCMLGVGVGITNLVTGKILDYVGHLSPQEQLSRWRDFQFTLMANATVAAMFGIVLNITDKLKGSPLNHKKRGRSKSSNEMHPQTSTETESAPLLTDRQSSVNTYAAVSVNQITEDA
ncbi:hypothetical protein ScPMuIL_016608 [Solemya velum]